MATIIFDAERMKYPNTGLYYYCLLLGNELAKLDIKKRLGFYVPESSFDAFPKDVFKIKPQTWHKLLMPRKADFKVWHTTYQLSSYLPTNNKIDVVLTIHDLNFLKEGKSSVKEKKYLSQLQNNVDNASRITTISHYVKKEIEEYCNLGGKTVEVIYNGSNFNTHSLSRSIKSRINSRPYLFTIGTIVGKKNFHVLPYLLINNDLELLIAGITQDVDYKNKIISIAEKCGVAERVKFLGAITEEEKINYMTHCELFVFPSIAEGFGLPVVEAMALGKKTLLSSMTSLPEIGGELSYYFDNFEEEYLRDFGGNRLAGILGSDALSADIIKWSEQFCWEKAAQSYWEVYNTLLNA